MTINMILSIGLIIAALQSINIYSISNKSNYSLSLSNKKYSDGDVLENKKEDNSRYLTSYSDFKTSYFENLTTNYGVNYKGSCGYIAIAMLLSYYDSFLNDSIIPENYDVISFGTETDMTSRHNSPGIYRDVIQNADNMSASEYLNVINSMSNYSLHAKLISIGSTLGFYDSLNNSQPCGTVYSNRIDIINYYLSVFKNLTSGIDYTISGIDWTDGGGPMSANSYIIEETAIQYLEDGYPVLLSINNNMSSGHVVVAYDYYVNGNDKIIYFHPGVSNYSTRATIDDLGFLYYTSAVKIDFNLFHDHPKNYSVQLYQNLTKYYCYKQCGIHTYDLPSSQIEHIDFHYTYYTNTKHKRWCDGCGALKGQESHSVDGNTLFQIGNTWYGTCTKCNSQINLGNIIGPLNSIVTLSDGTIVFIERNKNHEC